MPGQTRIHTELSLMEVELNSLDWVYLAEGNRHVVCRYRARDGAERDPSLSGHVLRLVKQNRTMNSTRVMQLSSLVSDRILNPFWGFCAIPPSRLVSVSSSFVTELRTRILPHRPLHRTEYDLDELAEYCELIQDVTLSFEYYFPNHNFASTLSVEIKVKCGLKSCSAFITEENAIKRLYSRFQIKQKFKSASKGVCPSDYDPADLCSGERDRVAAALRSLCENPQNNFAVWRNGVSSCQTDLDASNMPVIVEALSAVLSSEQKVVLTRLQLLQSFDALESEGAACVFNRLVNLVGSSYESEQLLLESIDERILTQAERIFCSDGAEPFSPPWAAISTLFQLSKSEMHEGLLADATSLVDSMNREECVLALQLWLLALAAKDASLVVNLAFVQQHATITTTGQGLGWGVVHITGADSCIAYSMSIVDMGIKDPAKCRGKIEMEEREKNHALSHRQRLP